MAQVTGKEMKDMTMSNHLAALERKHAELETMIVQALASPSIDDLHIGDLKRKKLQLKDEIEKLRGQFA